MKADEDKAAKHRESFGWKLFPVGAEFVGAGVVILSEAIILGSGMRYTHYDIRYMCCGQTARMSHEKIRERGRKGSTRCRRCGLRVTQQKKRQKRDPTYEPDPMPDYGWLIPAWPVPSHVRRGREGLWYDRAGGVE